jgi:hypothetical protein
LYYSSHSSFTHSLSTGGQDSANIYDELWRYSPTDFSWLLIQPASLNRPRPRAFHKAYHRLGRLIIYGGHASSVWTSGVFKEALIPS